MEVTITKHFTFDAAHYLEDYAGDCSRMHGHTYKLEVTISGDPADDMVVDFKTLKGVVESAIITRLDHFVLNEVLPFNPTAENLAKWIFEEVTLNQHFNVKKIRLWETPNAYAEVTA